MSAPVKMVDLARRWEWWRDGCGVDSERPPKGACDQDASLAWIQRMTDMCLTTEGWATLAAWVRAWCEETQDPDYGIGTDDREAIAHDLMLALGEPFTTDPAGEHGATWELIDAAEAWPARPRLARCHLCDGTRVIRRGFVSQPCQCVRRGAEVMSDETREQCSATCAHGKRCSRRAAPYGRGMCEQHRTQADRRDREDREARAVEMLEGLAEDYWEERETRGYL